MPRFRAIFSEFGLTETQWRVLRVLWEAEGQTLSELSEGTLITAPSLVGVVDRLSRDGLVRRRRSKVDRRSVLVYLSARGRSLETAILPLVEEVYDEIDAVLTRSEWRALFEALDCLGEEFGGESEIDEPRASG